MGGAAALFASSPFESATADADSADVTSSGMSFQVREPTTRKAGLATVAILTEDIAKRLTPAQSRSRRRSRLDQGSAASPVRARP